MVSGGLQRLDATATVREDWPLAEVPEQLVVPCLIRPVDGAGTQVGHPLLGVFNTWTPGP